MLKKLATIGAAAAITVFGVAGVAYADGQHQKQYHKSTGQGPDCSSQEATNQTNYGNQVVGGNLNLKNITAGVLSGSADKIAVCPSVGNNNSIGR